MILGFLGSFGHCVSMCGPLTVAFSLSQQRQESSNWRSSLGFHLLLNLGRILSYGLIGAILGGLGQILVARGQLAGIGSELRQLIAIFTGLMLIWLGLVQVKPNFFLQLPIVHPLQGRLHQRLSSGMVQLSLETQWWTPLLLGLMWGLIPCGFLYTAQIKATETSNFWLGGATMLAFGLGTMPMMMGVGVSASKLSASRRSQLFRLGGWITLTIGILTLLRTDAMVDFTGYGALLLLMWALIARPLSGLWAAPLQYRRAMGVGSFAMAVAHTGSMLEHSFNWNLEALFYLLPQHQWGMIAGILALMLIIPPACTSFNSLQKALGKIWRLIHLLAIPALILAVIHTLLIGSHYWGELEGIRGNQLQAFSLIMITLGVLLVRSHFFWSLLSLEKFYIQRQKKAGEQGRISKN